VARVGIGGAVVAAAGATACSLLVSTSGFSGGGSDAGPDVAFSPAEAGVADGGARVDAGDARAGDGGDASPPGDPDLLGAWSFDEMVGVTAHDASGKGHDAALDGALFVADGVSGGAVQLDEDAKVRVALLDGPAFPKDGTISLWFRHAYTVSDGDRGLFDGWDKTRSHVFLRRVGGATPTHFQAALQPADVTGTGAYAFASSFDTPAGVWTHVVITWSDTSRAGALYVDGALIAIESYDYDFEPQGQSFTLGDGFIGEIDEVRLYARALSGAEVVALP
jgi:hypothetical protein